MTAEQRKLFNMAVFARIATLLDDQATIEKMFDDGYEPGHGMNGFAPLVVFATMLGSMPVLNMLLERKANVNVSISMQRRKLTPLHVATLLGFADVAKALIGAGASALLNAGPDRLQGIEPFLFAACAAGQAELLQLFVEEHACDPTVMIALPSALTQGPPASPAIAQARLVLPSMPLDCLHAACAGPRAYNQELCDLLEVTLSPVLEALGGNFRIPQEALPAWPRGSAPAVAAAAAGTGAGEGLGGARRPPARRNTRAVLSLLLDRYGLGGSGSGAADAGAGVAASASGRMLGPFPPARWHEYARIAALHANAEAVAFFLERGLLDNPPPEAPLAVFEQAAAPAVADRAAEAPAGALAAVKTSLLGFATGGALSYPVTGPEAMQAVVTRVVARPPFTFKLLFLCPPAAALAEQALALPRDVARTGAAIAVHAASLAAASGPGAMGAGPAGKPRLSRDYRPAIAAACEPLVGMFTEIRQQLPARAPYYAAQNRGEVMEKSAIHAAEGSNNAFASGLLALSVFKQKDPQTDAALADASGVTKAASAAAVGDPSVADMAAAPVSEAAVVGLLDPGCEMTQERFTRLCHAVAAHKLPREDRWDAMWRVPVSAAVEPEVGAAAAGAATVSAGGRSEEHALLRALLPPESVAADGASDGAGEGRGLAGAVRSGLQLAKQSFTGGGSRAEADVIGKGVARHMLLRATRRQVQGVLWYHRNPHTLSLASALWCAAEDVATPQFWQAVPGRVASILDAAVAGDAAAEPYLPASAASGIAATGATAAADILDDGSGDDVVKALRAVSGGASTDSLTASRGRLLEASMSHEDARAAVAGAKAMRHAGLCSRVWFPAAMGVVVAAAAWVLTAVRPGSGY
jgi:hypothetical protein